MMVDGNLFTYGRIARKKMGGEVGADDATSAGRRHIPPPIENVPGRCSSAGKLKLFRRAGHRSPEVPRFRYFTGTWSCATGAMAAASVICFCSASTSAAAMTGFFIAFTTPDATG